MTDEIKEQETLVQEAPEVQAVPPQEPEAPEVQEEKYVPRVQSVIDYLEKGERPWFLSTVEIYGLAKKTVDLIPYSQTLFDKSLIALSLVTKYINESTKSNLVLDADQCHELIEKLDSILSESLVILDDGLDGLRAKLSSHLRQLLVAVVNHKKWAESKADKTKAAAVETVRTRYELALQFVTSLVEKVKEKFPAAAEFIQKTTDTVQKTTTAAKDYAAGVNESVKSFANDVKGKIDTQTFSSLIYLLQVAQPYVHKLVNTSAPLVSRTLTVSQPYINQAKPHVEKIVSKAVDVTNTLKENKLVGAYVDSALGYAQVAIDETKNYVIPPEQSQ